MSEWDFLWGLKGKEHEDAMASGLDRFDIEYVDKNEYQQTRKDEWENLKLLRDSGAITMDEFRSKKREIFPEQYKK